MHGITLTSAPSDWEILQQTDKKATVTLKGSFQVHPAAIQVGVDHVTPIARVMREDDNMTVIPWTKADHFSCDDQFRGTFDITLTVRFRSEVETGKHTWTKQIRTKNIATKMPMPNRTAI